MSEHEQSCPACGAPVVIIGRTTMHYEAVGAATVLRHGEEKCGMCGAQPDAATRVLPAGVSHPVWGETEAGGEG
jgi:hypothetical protein